MQRLIEATMQRTVLVIVCIVLILVWGGWSAWQMQRDYLPPINSSTLTVTVRAPEQDATQIQSTIGKAIEKAVHAVDGLQDVESDAFDGGMLTSLYFPLNADMTAAEAAVNQAVSSLQLPPGVQKPIVSRVSSNSFPIMRISLMSNGLTVSDTDLRTIVQAQIEQELKSIPGVRDVLVTGAGNQGFIVNVRMPALQASGVTLADLKRALTTWNLSWPQGSVPTDQGAIPIRVTGWEQGLQELQQLQVTGQNGNHVPISKIAEVTATTVNLQTISRTDGQASVLFDVLKTSSSNITDVSSLVKERLQNIPGVNMHNIHLDVQFDQGEQVKTALNGLIREGLLGCLFAMVSVFLFFRNVRSTVLIALSLPICLLATTGILQGLGVSLNLLTVSGLIVAMGRVVDDSIVILDNMVRTVQETNGRWTLSTLASAVREMMPAIVSSTATTIAVYLPIAMVGGMISSAFSGFAWAVVIALIISLLVSVMLVPALAGRWWQGQRPHLTAPVEPFAKRVLLFAIRKQKWVVSVSLVLLIGTVYLAALFPVNFLPTPKTGNVAVQVELPDGTSLLEVDAEVKRIEAVLKKNADISTFSTSLGSNFTPQNDDVFDPSGGWIQSANVANIAVTTKRGVDLNAFISILRNELHVASHTAICTVTDQNISGDDSQLRIELSGADQQTLHKTAQLIQSKLGLVPGISVEGEADQEGTPPKYHLILNQTKIEQAGVNPAEIYQVIDQYLTHQSATQIGTSAQPISEPIVLQLQTSSVANGGDPDKEVLLSLAGEKVHDGDGKMIPLSQLTSLTQETTSAHVGERDGRPFAVVSGNIISPDIEKVTGQVQDVIDQLPLASGVQVSFGGITGQVQHMISDMAVAFGFSILLVLLIVSTVFRGWKAPLSVLICIPLAFIGSVWSMYLFGKQWDLAALVGLLMLTGIVVTNGIVLVDKIERNRKDGLLLQQAVLQGALSRVRPVLMTAVTTILTLLPLSLVHDDNNVISQTLGVVVIGGMISSTLISLVLVPITYHWIMGEKGLKVFSKRRLFASTS